MANNTQFWNSSQLIETITKNKRENIEIKLNEREGIKYIDIRIHEKPYNSTEYFPTQKGVTLSLDIFNQMIKSVNDYMESNKNEFDSEVSQYSSD